MKKFMNNFSAAALLLMAVAVMTSMSSCTSDQDDGFLSVTPMDLSMGGGKGETASVGITFISRKCLKMKHLRLSFCHFAPHLPHQIVKETHKRGSAIRHFYGSIPQVEVFIFSSCFYTIILSELAPQKLFLEGQPCVNES